MRRFFAGLLDRLGLLRLVQDLFQISRYHLNFSLKSKNRSFIKIGAPDGLPLPPPYLANLVADNFDVEEFYRNGHLGADCIRRNLERNGLRIEEFSSILDFGCGCGRIIRHWKTLMKPEIHGTDYSRYLIQWCRKNLIFAEFKVNKHDPPLDYEDGKFFFIYAISVFTHLAEMGQRPWMQELWRILEPGGYLLITVHGESRLQQLLPEDSAKFKAGHLVSIREKYSGTNVCGVFHPEQFVRKTLAEGFAVVDFIPLGAKDANQDMYLFRKPGGFSY